MKHSKSAGDRGRPSGGAIFQYHPARHAVQIALCLLLWLALYVPAFCLPPSADGDAITGVWVVAEKDAHIEIYREGVAYYGRIAWLRENGDPSKDAPRESDMFEVPRVGLVIVRGFEFNGKEWTGGTLYNPTDGKSYRGVISLGRNGELRVRGFLWTRLIGRTTVWHRAPLNTAMAAS